MTNNLYWGHEYDARSTEVLYAAADQGNTTAIQALRARDARAMLRNRVTEMAQARGVWVEPLRLHPEEKSRQGITLTLTDMERLLGLPVSDTENG
jgi:hypothetical protein